MTTMKTVMRIVLICAICTATMVSISASDGAISASEFTSAQYNSATGEGEYIHSLFYGVSQGCAKQTTVPIDFIGPLAANQEYEIETKTVNMTTFYGNVITVDVTNYYR